MRAHWRSGAYLLLAIQLPAIVFDRVYLPLGIEFGSRSFARNVGLYLVLGVLIGARGMPRFRSALLWPLLLFLVTATLSVAMAGSRWGDVNSLGAMLVLFAGARSIASTREGRDWLFHWLGLLTATIVALEVVQNPSILQLREELRGTTVTAHPNTLGVLFALLGPLFFASIRSDTKPLPAALYAATTVLGASFTFSRLAWSSLLLGGLAIALAGRSQRQRVLFASGLLAVLLVGGAIAYLSLGRSEADWQRLRIIYTSLTLFQEHSLFGVGFGTGNLAQLFPARYVELYGSDLFLFHSHNMYVDVLVGTGMLGAAAFCWFIWRLGQVAQRCVEAGRLRPELRLRAAGFAATVLVFLFIGVGDMPLYHAKIVFPLAILWGLMEGWTEYARSDSRRAVSKLLEEDALSRPAS